MKKFKYLIAGVAILGLVGCSENGGISKQGVGALTGGVAGGLLGASVFHGDSQVIGALGGAVIGTMVGAAIGHSMDEQDRINAQQAMINTQLGQQASWTNQKSGANYTVKPVREYDRGTEHCRYALTKVEIDGKTDKAYTTICQSAKGGPWYVKNKK